MTFQPLFNFYFNVQKVLDTGEILPIFNVGETTRTFQRRKKDGDWAKAIISLGAAGIELVTQDWWEGFSLRTDKVTNHDSKIHKWLVLQPGIWKANIDGSQRGEWFKFDPKKYTHQMIREMIHEEFFSGKVKETKDYELRPYQKTFLKKISKAWKRGYEEFLLFAKCRSGKSMMVLRHIVDHGFKFTVVCSRFTSPQQSWRDDAKDYFPSIKYISLEQSNWKEEIEFWMDKPIQIVLWGSVQALVNRDIPKPDLVIADESHIGAEAKQFTELKDRYNAKILYLSGTAYKLVWKFNDDNKFVYTYFDEQLDSRNGVFKEPRPEMIPIICQYMTAEYRNIFGDDPDSIKNIFMIDKNTKKFLNPKLVSDFASYYFGKQEKLRLDDKLIKGKVIMMALPGIAACHEFKKIVECYYPASIVVTSDTKMKSDQINKFINENDQKALIITSEANVLGFTNDKIDTIINCKGGEALEFWIQFAFRGGSGKHDWWMIDFSGKRALKAINTAFQLACDSNPALREYHEVDFMNLQDWTNGFRKLTKEEFDSILSTDIDSTMSAMESLESILNLDDVEFNYNVTTFATINASSKVLKTAVAGDESMNNEGAYKAEVETAKKSEDPNALKKKVVKAILKSIPLCIFYILKEGKNVNTIDDVLKSPIYSDISGDTEGILSDVIDANHNSREKLTRRIGTESRTIITSMRESVTKTLDTLSVSSAIQQPIPLIILDPMIDKLKDTSQTLIHSDPSGSHTARLLEQNVNVHELTVWDDCANHRNRVEYIDKHVTLTNEQPVLRPTAILANPPYQNTDNKAKNNKLWPKFLMQHVDMLVDGGDMCEVSPASFIGTTGFGKKFLKLCSTIYNLKEIDYTADQYFSQNVKICSWHLTKEPYKGKTKVITDDGEFNWDLRNGVPLWGDNLVQSSILEKIANSSHPRIPLKMGQAIATEDYCDDGEFEVLHSGNNPANTNVEPDTGDVLKFVVPYSMSYKKRFITNAHIGMLNAWCPIIDEEEGERLSKIFEHPLIQLYIDNHKRTSGFAPAVKNGEVPDITDYDNLDTQFNFTEEEVAYLVDINVIKE